VALTVTAVTARPGTAEAEDNGTGLVPAMGWSSWSFLRAHPTAAAIEAQAKALVTSGLAAVGYQYVNIDDHWYVCPGSQGPAVDQWGRWATDDHAFPPGPAGENGIKVVADYVHRLGLRFGIYVTPGISKQAVARDTPVLGPHGRPSGYTADEIAQPKDPEYNYNCGGMVGLNYRSPGAQEFIDSWADEFAAWGADYVKLDGVGSFDVPDVKAWSEALRQTGRPMHLELSNALNIKYASTWEAYSNGWRTTDDIECYDCESNGSSYPLTDWANVFSRFQAVAGWQPYGRPGAFNDYDSIEVGNGANDGLTLPERQTQLSLWALGSSPLILGADLTRLAQPDLSLLTNRAVIAVDQDGIDASRVAESASSQVFAKKEPNGDAIVGLFNTGATTGVLSTTAAALGLPRTGSYELDDLWSGRLTGTTGTVATSVPSHGVALYRVTAEPQGLSLPPSVVFRLSTGTDQVAAGVPTIVTGALTNDGGRSVTDVNVRLLVPSGWVATPRTAHLAAVKAGQTGLVRFRVIAAPPSSSQLFAAAEVSATVTDVAPALPGPGATGQQAVDQSASGSVSVTVGSPVRAPFRTFATTNSVGTAFAQHGQQLEIASAGTRLSAQSDTYGAIYRHAVVVPSTTTEVEISSQTALVGYAKGGLMLRNHINRPGSTPEGVTLFESPAGGIQMAWDSNGGDHLTTVAPLAGRNPASLPVYLMLQRTSSDQYAGYYSFDGSRWLPVSTAQVPGQAATQDAGLFAASPVSSAPAVVNFNGFRTTAGAVPPPRWAAPAPCFSLSCS
jgi:hypothetical protein